MVRRWGRLVGVTPLLLGMVVAVPQMVMAPLVLAKNADHSDNRVNLAAQRSYREGEQLRQRGTRESLQQALENFQRALSGFRSIRDNSIRDRTKEANTLNSIGLVYASLGQPEQALNFYQQALTIFKIYDRSGEAATLNNIGLVYSSLGQPEQALDYLQQALPIRRQVSDRSGEVNILGNLAVIKSSLGNLPEALQDIQDAIAIVEDIRGQLISPELSTLYFASVQDYYKLQIDLLMQLHTSTTLSNRPENPDQSYAAQAFNVTERSKASTLLELLTKSRVDIRTGVDPQLLQQEQDIQRQLAVINQRRIAPGRTTINTPAVKQQIATLENQRAALQTQFQVLQTQIRTTSPKYAALKYPQPLTLEQVQQQILDDDTVILSYSLGEERSYLWLVSKTEMISYQLPSQKIIEDIINKKARSQLTNRFTSRDRFLADTIDLSNILLKPILEKVGDKRLAIIGDGALQYLPFGALPDPRVSDQYQPLLVNNEVVYLPSATTLQTLRNEAQNRPTPPKTLAILADPVFSADDPRVSMQQLIRLSHP